MIFKKLFEIFEEHDLFVMTLRLKTLRLVRYQVMLLILTVPWKLVKTYWRRWKDIMLVSFPSNRCGKQWVWVKSWKSLRILRKWQLYIKICRFRVSLQLLQIALSEAALQSYSYKNIFLKYAANLQENIHAPKCDFNKVGKKLYWNRASTCVVSYKFPAYFQNRFLKERLWRATFDLLQCHQYRCILLKTLNWLNPLVNFQCSCSMVKYILDGRNLKMGKWAQH